MRLLHHLEREDERKQSKHILRTPVSKISEREFQQFGNYLKMPMSLVIQLQVQYMQSGIERLPIILRAMASLVKIEAHYLRHCCELIPAIRNKPES